LQWCALSIESLQAIAGTALSTWILMTHVGQSSELQDILLLAYWVLNLPLLGEEFSQLIQNYPQHRNLVMRLLEPLGTGDFADNADVGPLTTPLRVQSGVALAFHDISICAAGQTILSDVNVAIEPGQHVAVVGASGAGKSSLLSLLLG